MLEIGKCYRNNRGDLITIGGRVKKYNAIECPWVWSISGDWYDENTGGLIKSVQQKVVSHRRQL